MAGKISIHALRGEGDDDKIKISEVLHISIHALRGEGDNNIVENAEKHDTFQSTPSVGRAT